MIESTIIFKSIDFKSKNINGFNIKINNGDYNKFSNVLWTTNNLNYDITFPYDYRHTIVIKFYKLDENNTLIGHSQIINQEYKNKNFDISLGINVIGFMNIDLHIYPKFLSYFLKPKSNFKYENSNSIKIIKSNFHDQDSKYDYYSEAFLNIINDSNNIPPLYFGLIGPDNYGKSDLLSSLKNKLYNDTYFKKIIVEFNPWSFEADDTIWASLLMKIHDALQNEFGNLNLKWIRLKKLFFPNTKYIIIFFLRLLLTFVLISLLIILDFNKHFIPNIFVSLFLSISSLLLLKDIFGFTKGLLFSITDIILSKIRKPDWTKQLGFLNEIKEEFFDFINPIIKENDLRLVILIDDLDKCSIEKIYLVIKVLSLIKYSDCPIYVFLTYDSHKINESIKNYYHLKYHKNFNDSNYLMEKLINLPFCLPGREIVENLYILNDKVSIKMNSPQFSPLKSKDIDNNFLLNQNETIDIDKINIVIPSENISRSNSSNITDNEINFLQNIIENTKNSSNALTNNQLIKIINIFNLSKYILPNHLKSKKFTLLHLIILCENWLKIMVYLYHIIKKLKFNLTFNEIKESFQEKLILFLYLNENLKNNDEFILYLTKFEIKIIDFIELEPYLFNLDRCIQVYKKDLE